MTAGQEGTALHEVQQIPIGQGPEALSAMVFASPEAIGDYVATLILDGVRIAREAGRPYLLGCPTGRTPMSSYQALGRRAALAGTDLSQVTLVMMDDYVVPSGNGFEHCPAAAHYSCRRAAWEDILGAIHAGVDVPHRISLDRVWFADPAQPDAYDRRIRDAGGIDLFITASGASDGHVAFNAPGSSIDSGCRIVPLAATTRADNLLTFPRFKGIDEVPSHGVTVGLGTIRSLSRQVALLIHGANKRNAVRRLAACRGYDSQWPASFIYRCANPLVILDRSAMP